MVNQHIPYIISVNINCIPHWKYATMESGVMRSWFSQPCQHNNGVVNTILGNIQSGLALFELDIKVLQIFDSSTCAPFHRIYI